MPQPPDLPSRRPLKSRSSAWAGAVARMLLKAGCRPNGVSLGSIFFAAAAGVCLWLVPRACCGAAEWLLWLGAAAGIQLRLLCNLMDGMLAVEGGLKSPLGDLYNEVPDRAADVLILLGAGLGAGQWQPWAVHAGWAACAAALFTAYVRVMGAALTGKHDFRGPMAKPQRMALLTLACVVSPVEHAVTGRPPVSLAAALVVISAGGVWTGCRRLSGIARILLQRPA